MREMSFALIIIIRIKIEQNFHFLSMSENYVLQPKKKLADDKWNL